MSYIFILLLEKKKFYIGSCRNPHNDIKPYFNNFGPDWVKKYRPIKIVEIIHPCDIFDVDKHTKRYMAKYGVNNVRGGTYSNLKLTKQDHNHIDKEIFNALGMCMYCGSEYHFSYNCQYNTFSSQVQNIITSFKMKLTSFKDCLEKTTQPYIDYIKQKPKTTQKYNKKYNTLAHYSEEKPMILVNSPQSQNNKEIYEYQLKNEREMEFSQDRNHPFLQSRTPSLSSSYSPQPSPLLSPLKSQKLQLSQLSIPSPPPLSPQFDSPSSSLTLSPILYENDKKIDVIIKDENPLSRGIYKKNIKTEIPLGKEPLGDLVVSQTL